MEKKSNEPGVIRWKKLHGGSFTALIEGKKRIIKRNQIFNARLEEIPLGFRDVVVPLDELSKGKVAPKVHSKVKEVPPKVTEAPIKAPEVPPVPLEYFVKARKGGGYFDVVDADGKVQNEKALRKEPAEELLNSLKA